MATTIEGVRGQRHAPAALYSREDPVPIVQESCVGPRARLDWCGFDPRTVQSVASHYTDGATQPTKTPIGH